MNGFFRPPVFKDGEVLRTEPPPLLHVIELLTLALDGFHELRAGGAQLPCIAVLAGNQVIPHVNLVQGLSAQGRREDGLFGCGLEVNRAGGVPRASPMGSAGRATVLAHPRPQCPRWP